MYGCSGKVNDRLKERIFPCLIEKNCDIFSFADCCFAVQKAKESTARIVMWKELGITNSYTLESSFCGADYGKYADFHFNTDLLQEVGHKFCETIIDFCDPDQIKVKSILEELEIMFPKNSDDESDEGSNAESDFSGDEGKLTKKKKVPGAKGAAKPAAAAGTEKPKATGVKKVVVAKKEDPVEKKKK